jgi:hypothetical protein
MKKFLFYVVNICLIVSLLIPSGLVEGMKNLASDPAASSGLYRTRVTIDQPYDLTRLQDLGIKILEQESSWTSVLVSDAQLEDLARLGFEPQASNELMLLVSASADVSPWLASSLSAQLDQAIAFTNSVESSQINGSDVDDSTIIDIIEGFSIEQLAGIQALPGVDNDADGLTDTQESWWCTDPNNGDSDSDGRSDYAEIQAIKDWMANRRAVAPGETPWATWPFNTTTCPDKDYDSIPNLAERWELGLNMDLESTDRDKFDDGQEVFGVTYCPGGDYSCGYGDLPRSSDAGYVGQTMPSWVKAPGNHPYAAAFPLPDVSIDESSFHVQTVTVVTTDHVISSGTETTYSTTETSGTSTSNTDTLTWNNWEENSTTQYNYQPGSIFYSGGQELDQPTMTNKKPSRSRQTSVVKQISSGFSIGEQVLDFASLPLKAWELGTQYGEGINKAIYVGTRMIDDVRSGEKIQMPVNYFEEYDEMYGESQTCSSYCGQGLTNVDPSAGMSYQDYENQNYVNARSGRSTFIDGQDVYSQRYFPISYPAPKIESTSTNSNGHSWGESQSTTNTEYEEHAVTNGEAFSSEESWGSATAEDSAHAADFWFTYRIKNIGTEYAKELTNLTFNIYLGDNRNPIYTYYVAADLGGDGKFYNLLPDEEHVFTSSRIPLTLEQMKAIDIGASIRVVVEDFSYGSDELFYENAANENITISIDDGMEDGNEIIDNYLIPIWENETVLDVIGRYFPFETDSMNSIMAFWTPEMRATIPGWCMDPSLLGSGTQTVLWCKHTLSTTEWWNVYSEGVGEGNEGFQDTLATPGGYALFRFNKDSDFDGFSDRAEEYAGTSPSDVAEFPKPELLAGINSTKVAENVTSTLSLTNMGLYDAYGVEAVMIAPDDSITVSNNTVGGSGRVKAGKSVVVGSQITQPIMASWTGTAKPTSLGYYSGTVDKLYTFTVNCTNPGGCDVSSGEWDLGWADSLGGTGTLDFSDGYNSPNSLQVDSYGLEIGLISGRVYDGNTFSVQALTPLDTFQYTINREPFAQPIVIVSYNDPQGNHRFVLPERTMNLATPADDLVPFSGTMLDINGVEIVTSDQFLPGSNITKVVVDNPTQKTIQDGNIFLEFIDPEGTVVLEAPVSQDFQSGPNIIDIAWDTAGFIPAYDSDQDYIVMAFWTDYEGNILDVSGRPLSSFQADPTPEFAMTPADETWDFGTAAQGTILKREFSFANTGERTLLTYVDAPAGLLVSQTGSKLIGPVDLATYEITLNTNDLPVGDYSDVITIHTSDPANPTLTIAISGSITAGEANLPALINQLPLDYSVAVPGPQSQGNWYNFQHPIGPDPQSIHPVKIYNQDYSQLWGVGRYATSFNAGTYSPDMFGDGRDGGIVVESGSSYFTDNNRATISGIVNSNQTLINFTNPSGGVSSAYVNYWPKYEWFDTGLKVSSGDRIVIYKDDGGSSLPKICYGGSGSLCYNAVGIDELAPTGWAGPGLRKYSLIGRVGNGTPFFMGENYDGYTTNSGTLYITGNDCSGCFQDNTREWWFRHQIFVYPSTTATFSQGDIALILQMTGSDAGNYEYAKIVSASNGSVVVSQPLHHSYVTSGNNVAQILRVPQFDNVTVRNGGTITAHSWSGSTGGVVAFFTKGQLTVETGGIITTFGLGFNGGREAVWSQPNSGPGFQGASFNGALQQQLDSANAGGGGGGINNGGGGGGYGTNGQTGSPTSGGIGGAIYGNSELSTVFLGSGGGGSGHYYEDAAQGGKGGGMILLTAKTVAISGSVTAGGQGGWQGPYGGENTAPTPPNKDTRMGGGGAGGSIKIVASSGFIGEGKIAAVGGPGGKYSSDHGWGGNGGFGRIRLESCEGITGSTNPTASSAILNCFISEQVETLPYTTTRLNLPETITNTKTYAIQYGRRLVFSASGNQTTTLRLPAGYLKSADMDILISNAGVGDLTISMDIGNNGSTDYTWTGSVNNLIARENIAFTAAYNQWWSASSKQLAGTVDVPVKITLSKAAQILLTDVKVSTYGSNLNRIQLESGSYSEVLVDIKATGATNPLSLGIDVGDDGTIDQLITVNSPSNPHYITSTNLASQVNTYLSGLTGLVNVPIRLFLYNATQAGITNFSASIIGNKDLSLSASDITLPASDPMETDVVPVSATFHNNGNLPSGSFTVGFFASIPDVGEWYIGSALLPSVLPGQSASAEILWNTSGFTGLTSVKVVADPFGHIQETNEENNQAVGEIYVRTRPDLSVTAIDPSDPEPKTGELIQITIVEKNLGETETSLSTLALYDGNPDEGGVLIGEQSASLIGGSEASFTFDWQPLTTSWHRLYAKPDVADAVNEFDEENNLSWKDVYIGLAGPIMLDSGTANDPVYSQESGFGHIDINLPDQVTTCGLGNLAEDTVRRDPDGKVLYQFDHLLPGHFYHLDITLYECDGAGRQEYILVDDNQIAGPEDLGDGQVHRLSLRLDPAFYVDRSVTIAIQADGIDGAVVSEVNLHDIDYRYADAGGGDDPQYPGDEAFGWIDGSPVLTWGTLPYQSVRVDQSDDTLNYQFDNLSPNKLYNVHFTFWQPSGTGRIQKVQVDGIDTGLSVNTGDYLRHQEMIAIPLSAYSSDGMAVISIVRTNATSGAMVNEIALEEETVFTNTGCVVQPTPYFSETYGSVLISGAIAPVGSVVQALNPRGDTVGCFTVTDEGLYGFMRIYGEDPSAIPLIPGMRNGEIVSYSVNGAPAVASPLFNWSDDHAVHNINLNAGNISGQSILLQPGWNLISFNVEPPVPMVTSVLQSIASRYDRVLGENGIYVPSLPPEFNTLKELHSATGYYLRLTGTTSVSLLVEGIAQACSEPKLLHVGWNWIGGPCGVTETAAALVSIEGHYQRVLSLNKTYDPALPAFSTLKSLIPGEGYLIYMIDPATLIYPDVAMNLDKVDEVAEDSCSRVSATPFSTLAYGYIQINTDLAAEGSLVEFITPRGELAGCSLVAAGGILPLTQIYGGDGENIGGFLEGEEIFVRVDGIAIGGPLDFTWQDDKTPHELSINITIHKISLPLITH